MALERGIIIRANGLIELKPPADDPKLREMIDHSDSLKLISQVLSEAEKNGSPKIIGIQGPEDAGKSILAELLAETGKGSVVIVGLDPKSKGMDNIEQKGLPPMPDPSATYIFDEPVFVTESSLVSYTEMLIKGGGIAVFMCRNFNDLPDDVLGVLIKLELTQRSLTMAK